MFGFRTPGDNELRDSVPFATSDLLKYYLRSYLIITEFFLSWNSYGELLEVLLGEPLYILLNMFWLWLSIPGGDAALLDVVRLVDGSGDYLVDL